VEIYPFYDKPSPGGGWEFHRFMSGSASANEENVRVCYNRRLYLPLLATDPQHSRVGDQA